MSRVRGWSVTWSSVYIVLNIVGTTKTELTSPPWLLKVLFSFRAIQVGGATIHGLVHYTGTRLLLAGRYSFRKITNFANVSDFVIRGQIGTVGMLSGFIRIKKMAVCGCFANHPEQDEVLL